MHSTLAFHGSTSCGGYTHRAVIRRKWPLFTNCNLGSSSRGSGMIQSLRATIRRPLFQSRRKNVILCASKAKKPSTGSSKAPSPKKSSKTVVEDEEQEQEELEEIQGGEEQEVMTQVLDQEEQEEEEEEEEVKSTSKRKSTTLKKKKPPTDNGTPEQKKKTRIRSKQQQEEEELEGEAEEGEGEEEEPSPAEAFKEIYEDNMKWKKFMDRNDEFLERVERDDVFGEPRREDKYVEEGMLDQLRAREEAKIFTEGYEGEGEEEEQQEGVEGEGQEEGQGDIYEEETDEDERWDMDVDEEEEEGERERRVPLAERELKTQIEDVEGFEAEEGATEIQENDFVTVHYIMEDISGSTSESVSTYDEGNHAQTVQVTEDALPVGLAKGLLSMKVGQKKRVTVPPDEAYGEPDEELTMRIPLERVPSDLEEGSMLSVQGSMVMVREITDEDVVMDANHILAGCTLRYEIEVLAHYPKECLDIATFGCGSFWGAELAFQRVPGVIATEVGYANGNGEIVTHEEVQTGQTGYVEVVNMVYDPSQVTYEELLAVFFSIHDPTQFNRQGADIGPQYRSGIYIANPVQTDIADAAIEQYQEYFDRPIVTEIRPLQNYCPADGVHQQFLENGGRFGRPQSAEKGCRDPIRLYG